MYIRRFGGTLDREMYVITCVITRNYQLRYITLALRMFTRKVRNYAVITHFNYALYAFTA